MKSKSWNSLVKRQPNLPIGIATAILSLLLLAGIVASAMGQPLVTGQELLSAWGIAQMIAGAMLLLLVGVLSFWFIVVVVIPIRDSALSRRWEQKQQQGRGATTPPRAATQEQPATHSAERPIIYNNPANHLALKAERTKRENLQVLLDSITSGLSDLCYQVTGQREDDAARAIRVLQAGYLELVETMQELERQAKGAAQESTLETPPRGATWREVLALMEWARGHDRIGVRATRDVLRGRGVPIPEQEFGAFSASVQALAPLPHRPPMPQEQRPQRADSADKRSRTGQRSRTRNLPRKGAR